MTAEPVHISRAPFYLICAYCNEPFRVKPSRVKTGTHHFCCNEHKSLFQRKSVEVICGYCQQPFLAKACVLAAGQGKYCRDECWRAAQREAKQAKLEQGLAKQKCNHEIVCGGCGVTFVYNGPRPDRKKYCLSRCKSKAQRIRFLKSQVNNGNACEICDKSATCVPDSLRELGRGRYCKEHSYQQKGLALALAWKTGLIVSKKPNIRTSTPCEICGKPAAFVTPRQRASGGGRFCSQAHATIGTIDQRLQKRRLRKVKVHCTLCHRPFKRAISQLSDLNFCEQECYFTYIQAHPRLRYTPEFLRSLLEDLGETCPFPGCQSNRCKRQKNRISSTWNPWRLCEYHARLVGSAMRSRQQKRKAILQEHGLITEE